MWWFPINRAPDALRGAQDLLDGAREVLRERFGREDPCDGDYFVEGDVPRVLDVLLLFPVAWGLYTRPRSELSEGKGTKEGRGGELWTDL